MGLTIILPIIVVIPVKSAHRTFEPSSGVRVFTLPTAVKCASVRICGTKDRHRATGRSIRLERPMPRPAPNPLIAIEYDGRELRLSKGFLANEQPS
jgi:hypothetical protein